MSLSKPSKEHDPSHWGELIKLRWPLNAPPWIYFYTYGETYEYITRWADGRRLKSLLEVGTGTCLAPICTKLMHPWKRVVACDVVREVVEFARKRCEYWNVDIEVYVADARDLPFRDKEFDSCLSEGMLEHWLETDRIQMLREMSRVAKRLVIDLPVAERHPGCPMGYGDEDLRPPEYWRGLFKRCGLRLVEEYTRQRRRDKVPVRVGWILE